MWGRSLGCLVVWKWCVSRVVFMLSDDRHDSLIYDPCLFAFQLLFAHCCVTSASTS